jgi:hypothetical protein
MDHILKKIPSIHKRSTKHHHPILPYRLALSTNFQDLVRAETSLESSTGGLGKAG